MRSTWLICLFFTQTIWLTAQICDDFSDGDLTVNPPWTGAITDFVHDNEGRLQLNAGAAGTATLALPVSFPDTTQWDLLFEMAFAPSTSNLLRIYLAADQEDLISGNGYFLEIGEIGNTDAIRFFSQENGTAFIAASSETGVVADEPVIVRMQMLRFPPGNWVLRADFSGGEEFQTVFSIGESTLALADMSFFGIYCKFSETRKDKFFFDDLCVGAVVPDTKAPELLEVSVANSNTLQLTFDEVLSSTAADKSNYSVSGGIGSPETVDLNGDQVTLSFASTFVSATEYILTVMNLQDTSGNEAENVTGTFTYIEISNAFQFDILINEIMADPSPAVSLPNAEYLELYNNSGSTFDLADYRLKVGSKTHTFLPTVFAPDTYIIVCSESDAALFESYGSVATTPTSLSLTNTGTTVSIQDQFEKNIHEVDYDISWYRDGFKDEGGWSLALINPSNVCAAAVNWIASTDFRGGTPGQINGVFENIPDLDGPVLESVFPSNANNLILTFNESLDETASSEISNYAITPSIDIANVELTNANQLTITFFENLATSVLYEIQVISVLDCQGNPASGLQSITLGIAESILLYDLVINEVLFNPNTGGVRFLEFYNRSEKFLKANEVVVGELENGQVDIMAVTEEFLIFPDSYFALTPDRQDILDRYTVANPNALLTAELPTWDANKGNVIVLSNGVLIDSFSFTSDFHTPLLDDQNGVSIERINPELSTSLKDNWHSAAATASYGTPTAVNSQFVAGMDIQKPFEIVSSTFSPDEDGFEDFLLVEFSLDEPGFVANIEIFDSIGRPVRNLASNLTLGTEAVIKWDGTDQDGILGRIGTYIVLIELFQTNGNVQKFKEVAVLAQRL